MRSTRGRGPRGASPARGTGGRSTSCASSSPTVPTLPPRRRSPARRPTSTAGCGTAPPRARSRGTETLQRSPRSMPCSATRSTDPRWPRWTARQRLSPSAATRHTVVVCRPEGAHVSDLATIGVTGLAVMGSTLARNLARHGHTVAVHNRTSAKTQSLVQDHGSEGTFVPSDSTAEFVQSLERPRRIIIMVKAGAPTDAVIDELVPLLEEGDIVVDGGNAH